MPITRYRQDYQALPFEVKKIDLDFDLDDITRVISTMHIIPLSAQSSCILDGSATLKSVAINGVVTHDYSLGDNTLTLHNIPNQPFDLTIETEIDPYQNKSFSGLYASGAGLFTQCEAEGFRAITYFFDRPDILTFYTVRIEGDCHRYPVLLSNGNLIESGKLNHNRHFALWHDPFAKPCYLFALVAGKLARSEASFTTMSGKVVPIHFYTDEKDRHKTAFAIESLQNAMAWDEQRWNLEYDLDLYMVVAVSDFNMGAMENKGLNIFNTKYVLADTHTATDANFEAIESVIAHEYFHNYTGNRVTCRDWFELSLKEGLTVFRDQEFSADRASAAVRRIEQVRYLREHQFPEDASPNAHPIRPESYEEINNFYTVTVYEKGAEVVRMYHTLLGEEGFRAGLHYYLHKHDGTAATCDDFRHAMEQANHIDLTQFDLWYSQAGTPRLKAGGSLCEQQHTYTLTFEQSIPDTVGQSHKKPMMIPVRMALLDQNGNRLSFALEENGTLMDQAVLVVREAHQSFQLHHVHAQGVIASLLRGFSAPVILDFPYSEADLITLMQHDDDAFVRWEAVQTLYLHTLNAILRQEKNQKINWIQSLKSIISENEDPEFLSTLLQVPGTAELIVRYAPINPLRIHQAREILLQQIAQACADKAQHLTKILNAQIPHNLTSYHPHIAGLRTLRNTLRAMMVRADESQIEVLINEYHQNAHDMTEKMGILNAINHIKSSQKNDLLQSFAENFIDDALVMDKYFALIASSNAPDTPDNMQRAFAHQAFCIKNPNKVYALLGTFGRNTVHFHAPDGSGYALMVEKIIEIDRFNPQVASRLAKNFSVLPQLDECSQKTMRLSIEKLAAHHLSNDTSEIISKILNNA